MGCLGDINNELLVHIGAHLGTKDLRSFSLVCRKFALVAHSDVLWKEKLYNDYGIGYKLPGESWKEMYDRKTEDPNNCRICPHISCVDTRVLEPYAVKYQQVLHWLEKNLNCSTCKSSCKDTGLCLYVWKGNVRTRCKDCAYSYHKAVEGHGILIRMNVLQMFCFDCKRLLGDTRGDPSEAVHVNALLEYLTHGSELGRQAMDRKRQCMQERILYTEEADRLSVVQNGKYYFVDRLWLCSWFLRLCDGKIGDCAITNTDLEDPDNPGKLNPAARPRSNFKGGFSIVTPHLWKYLVNVYGLIGGTYSSDDIEEDKYRDLLQSIEDWRLN